MESPDPGFDLTGRRALVTGASAGIGAAIAARLATAGAHVVAVSRSGDVPDADGLVTGVVADLSRSADVDSVVPRALDVLGGLDIVVNNAGRGDFVELADIDRAHFDGLVSLNLWAPLRICQLAYPSLVDSPDPSVVMIGSIDAVRPSGGASVYGATKAGLGAITVALAREWAPDGIRINQVNPGLIDTPMARGEIDDMADTGARFTIVGRAGHGDEIAAQVHYLVAPVGRFATGRSFDIDGGALSLGPFDRFSDSDDV